MLRGCTLTRFVRISTGGHAAIAVIVKWSFPSYHMNMRTIAPRKRAKVTVSAKAASWDLGMQTVEAIEAGYRTSVLGEVSRESGIGESKLRELAGISVSTFARRRRAGRLSREESDRLASIRQVLAHVRLFFKGDAAAALRWLEHPARAFEYRKPIDLLSGSYGAREVERLINRIADGVFT